MSTLKHFSFTKLLATVAFAFVLLFASSAHAAPFQKDVDGTYHVTGCGDMAANDAPYVIKNDIIVGLSTSCFNITVPDVQVDNSEGYYTITANFTVNNDGVTTFGNWAGDDSSWGGQRTWVFNDGSYNIGNIIGNAIFNGEGFTSSNDYWRHNSSNQGVVNGKAVFNSMSGNYAVVRGGATFNDQAWSNGGEVFGTTTFTYASMGELHYDSPASYFGFITHGPVLGGDGVAITHLTLDGRNGGQQLLLESVWNTDVTFINGASVASDILNGNATFNDVDVSLNGITISGDVVINGGSVQSSDAATVINGNVTFNNSYLSGGTLTAASGTVVVFNDSNGTGYNGGTITGDVVFNGSSYNSGTITGNVIFNDNSFNNQSTIYGDATFTNSIYEDWPNEMAGMIGIVTGTVTFSASTSVEFVINNYGLDSLDTTNWVFTGGTPTWIINSNTLVQNSLSIQGNFIFNGSSGNSSVITSNAVFNDSTYNAGQVYGDATFNDQSYNDSGSGGSVIGDMYFTASTFDSNDFFGADPTGGWNRGGLSNNAYFTSTTSVTFTLHNEDYWNIDASDTTTLHFTTPGATWIFNDSSHNEYTVLDTTFNDGSYNAGTSVVGNAIFNATSTNQSTVTGDATFNMFTASSGVITIDNDPNFVGAGTVGGTAYDSNGADISNATWNFINGSVFVGGFGGILRGNAIFNDTSSNQ